LEACEGIARVTFTPRPAIVTARNSLRRGHWVTAGDLQYEPYAVETISLPVDAVLSPDDLIGLEVVGLVRPGVVLSPSAFVAPRVIRRGDLLEIRVGGGGVHVTTAAKALGDGAVGELIEIETLQPKRRLLARVVNSTLVEIITRAPQVRATPVTTESRR
jgi:flagella basal body P-ring formation protein FlgA